MPVRLWRDLDADQTRGLDERFWLEYVFEAYASHRAEAVFLIGLPDIPESRPHSRVNEARHLLGVGA